MTDALDALLAVAGRATPADRAREQVQRLLEDLADRDGCELLDTLLDAGHDRDTIASAATQGDDRRQRPKVVLQHVNGCAVAALSSSGWSAATGRADRRLSLPTAATLRHRTAPSRFRNWATDRTPALRPLGVLVDTIRGSDLRQHVENVLVAKAWNAVKHASNITESAEAGELVRGSVVPDLLWIESHEPANAAVTVRHAYPHLGSPFALVDPVPHEVVVAVEYQQHTTGSMLTKVERHSIAMRLGAWAAVLWIVPGDPSGREAAERLRRCGVGDAAVRPGHYLVPASAVGIDELPPVVPATWYWASLHQHS